MLQLNCDHCYTYVGVRTQRVERGQPGRPPQQTVSFATDPCHGLYCKRHWKRVMRRHDSIRDSLARTLELGLFKDVRATVEPRVPNPQTGADLRRGARGVATSRCTRAAPRGSWTSRRRSTPTSPTSPFHRGDWQLASWYGIPWYTCTMVRTRVQL